MIDRYGGGVCETGNENLQCIVPVILDCRKENHKKVKFYVINLEKRSELVFIQ